MARPAPSGTERHVAIVGAGFSGTLLAINLLRRSGTRVTLIERGAAPGQGVAYGTSRAEHLLNVRAANMSAFPDVPDHFERWLAARDPAATGADFVPRATYGAYLRDLLAAAQAESSGRLALVVGEAVEIVGRADVRLRDGRTIAADVAVLAAGNLPPHVPPGLEAVARSPGYFGNPWDPGATSGLGDDAVVLLVGTGLTMVDVALTLDARAFGGRILAVSRRGLLPHRHAPATPGAPPLAGPPAPPLSMMVRAVRRRADTVGWRSAIDELRPFTQDLWRHASSELRRRFLRHLRPWWDVHRHRIAPAVADRIAALIAAGHLTVAAGKLQAAAPAPHGFDVTWRRRGGDAAETVRVTRIIACIGPQGDLAHTDDPLLAALFASGRIRPDAERIGIAVDPYGGVLNRDGAGDPHLYAVGPMTRGTWWEIVAVPDIRRQLADVAARIAGGQ